ncbi:protein LTV1-like protein [Iris pallida]|uniref:Protein LTV1-like protein n=1 Tax=Iris pallida TaxID=29817 RepID=A0AAX6DQP5_IRIPA|nr:protein LTV1-like protein [Iris pallida]
MGKKKFIDKRKSATFQLLSRDSSSSSTAATITDRVFVRVDNNPYSIPALEEFAEDDSEQVDPDEQFGPDSIFADAPGDNEDDDEVGLRPPPVARGSLPDHVRREILEMGLPDDGYNYLLHLREIRNSGGGSAYYHNSKAKLDKVQLDVKAYDASRLRINADASGESNGDSNSIYKVASKAVGVKVQKAVDPDVARLLDDGDLSRFGSDVEDLDEDFVVKANLPDEAEEEQEELEGRGETDLCRNGSLKEEDGVVDGDRAAEAGVNEKPRVRRLLDEQFDLLALREYGSDDDDDDDYTGYVDAEDVPLAAKLNNALKPHAMDQLELEDKYRVPADLVHNHQGSSVDGELDTSDIIRKCVEYAEKYYNESHDDEEVVVVQESTEEFEIWDCETIVSTYSNLENHPGKIQAPENPKRRLPKIFPGESVPKNNIIELRGREKLPMEFLPRNRRAVEKVKAVVSPDIEQQKRKPHGEESKEEKKERKAAVKEERREARRAKKELKGLYKFEAQKAQKVAAVAGPSSMHLM